MRTVNIEINCGLTTCAAEPGKFCKYFGTIKFGQILVCRLFPSEEDSYTVLEELNGWTQRCGDCMVNEA